MTPPDIVRVRVSKSALEVYTVTMPELDGNEKDVGDPEDLSEEPGANGDCESGLAGCG